MIRTGGSTPDGTRVIGLILEAADIRTLKAGENITMALQRWAPDLPSEVILAISFTNDIEHSTRELLTGDRFAEGADIRVVPREPGQAQ